MNGEKLRVLLQAKHLRQPSGGNATYTLNLTSGLASHPEVDARTFGAESSKGRAGELLQQVFEGLSPAVRPSRGIYHFTADTGPLLRRRRSGVVTTVHGFAAAHVAGVRTPVSNRVWVERARHAIRISDHVVTVSHSSKRDLVTHLGADESSVTVIHHGIDHRRFNTTVDPARVVGATDTTGPFVLYVGNIEPRKNVARAVRGFCRSALPGEGWRFLIGGRPAWDYEESMLAIEEAGDSVVHLGFVSERDLPGLIRASRGFLFPSLYEGFGFPPLEAMACGVAVVMSDRGSLAEVTGSQAIVVEPESIDSIAAGLNGLLDSELVERITRAGLERAQGFQWSRSIDQHVDVYRRVGS